MKYRMGVARVSAGCRKGVELWFELRQKGTIWVNLSKNVDTCDTLAIPLRRGGCRSYYSYIPTLIASFQWFATPLNFFLFLAQQKNKLSFRCRKSKNNYA